MVKKVGCCPTEDRFGQELWLVQARPTTCLSEGKKADAGPDARSANPTQNKCTRF